MLLLRKVLSRFTSIVCFLTGLITAGLALPTNLNAQTMRLDVTADNSVVLVESEKSVNAGSQGRIRTKGNQHIVAMSFDTQGIKGKRIRSATLYCTPADEQIAGVTLSTIATPWNEQASCGQTAGVEGVDGWGYSGAGFPSVCGGNSFTMTHSVTSVIEEGRYAWDVPPDMVHALSLGVAYGIAIHEHDADYGRNPTIFSREQSAHQPVLIVTIADDVAEPPPVVATDLRVETGDSPALFLTAPEHGFAYEVDVDGNPLPRHNIPLVQNGRVQAIPLRDLPPSCLTAGEHTIRVHTISRSGQRSKPIAVTFVQPDRPTIGSAKVIFPAPATTPLPGVAVIPVTDKYDRDGNAVGPLPEDYRTHNPIYDGNRVRLIAAAGEVVGFQLLLRGNGEANIRLDFDDSFQPRIDWFQGQYVVRADQPTAAPIPDPLVPMPERVRLQTDQDQVFVADVYVPFDAKAGRHLGTIHLSSGRMIPIELSVLPFALPRQATFLCEMNGYGLPDRVEDYYSLQRIAYDHRVHANLVHYSHHSAAAGARNSSMDMRLASGRRMDNSRYNAIEPGATKAYWDDFAEAFGPYLDGSLFRDGHRGPIPAPGFYLTFHESWPLHCRPYFNGNLDAYQAFDDPAYANTYVNVLNDFVNRAQSEGWNQTGFQVYFNNKGSLKELTKAPWILDEPSSYWDYRALQYYAELTDRGLASASDVDVDYRVDISRPEFCRGQLQSRSDLWVVSSSAFRDYRRLVTDRIQRDKLKVWIYGTSNHVHESNRNIQAWALDARQYGAVGLVPWQTIDRTGKAMKTADQLGLFIFDESDEGEPIIRHSMRLKAYREAQQLIEYLNILKDRQEWSTSQLREFITGYVNLDSDITQTHAEDAGTSAYARLSAVGLETLRLAAARIIVQPD